MSGPASDPTGSKPEVDYTSELTQEQFDAAFGVVIATEYTVGQEDAAQVFQCRMAVISPEYKAMAAEIPAEAEIYLYFNT